LLLPSPSAHISPSVPPLASAPPSWPTPMRQPPP
jgi:hypothetical protein